MELDAFRQWTTRLQDRLNADSRVVGLVMLGSSAEVSRLPDVWSDHDFFVVTVDGVQESFRTDLSWLPDAEQIVLHPRETAHGLKVLFADGHLIEFAIFDRKELRLARVNDYRVLLDKTDGSIYRALPELAADSVPGHLDRERVIGLMLALFVVGAGRVARGEVLSGQRFIKDFALSEMLRLIAHEIPAALPRQDNLDPFRRVEICYPAIAAELQQALLLEPIAAAEAMLKLAEAHIRDLPQPALDVVQRVLKDTKAAQAG
jgi:lincosamide nucleotidyltransferase B/F